MGTFGEAAVDGVIGNPHRGRLLASDNEDLEFPRGKNGVLNGVVKKTSGYGTQV